MSVAPDMPGGPVLQVDSSALEAALVELNELRSRVAGADRVIGLTLRGQDPAGLDRQHLALGIATDGRGFGAQVRLVPSEALWTCVLLLRALADAQEKQGADDPLTKGFAELRRAIDGLARPTPGARAA